jgi:serine/threonine-protein kinase
MDAAVKVLLHEVKERPESLGRFLQEISAIGTISAHHENNVVKVYDTGLLEGDGRRYMLMEFCSGGSLESLLDDKGPLGFELTFTILGQVASALAAAHDAKIVHRDLKPANVLLVKKDGYIRAKLSDFGISKLIGERLDEALIRTRSMKVLGSCDYMAPEQANPKRGVPPDHRIDIYAFGALLYRCVTGRTPYMSQSVGEAIVNAALGAPFQKPSLVRPGVPRELDELIVACLAHDRDQRPQSMEDVMRRFADAIPAGHSLLPYVAPRFVAKVAAPSAVTISDGLGPAVAHVVGSASQARSLTGREPRIGGSSARRAVVAIALFAGIAVGGVARELANRTGAGPHAQGVGVAPTHESQRNENTVAVISATANLDAGLYSSLHVANIPSSDAAVGDAAQSSVAAEPMERAAAVSPVVHRDSRAIASPTTARANERRPEKRAPSPPPTAPASPARLGSKPALAARSGEGVIVVRVSPWANVWIDGVAYQTTPVRAMLEAGVHKVLLVADGHREKVSVTVTAGAESLVERTW